MDKSTSTPKRKVAIFLFNQVEVLDFAGPFEVFGVASEIHNHRLFDVSTFSLNKAPITAVNDLSVNPQFAIHEVTDADILIIPGGFGIRAILDNPGVLEFVSHMASRVEVLFSICSGAMLLAKAGLLQGKLYCTHHLIYPEIEHKFPGGIPQCGSRFSTDGNIITAAGISAGIDASLYMVESLCGKDVREATAKYMEYKLWED